MGSDKKDIIYGNIIYEIVIVLYLLILIYLNLYSEIMLILVVFFMANAS